MPFVSMPPPAPPITPPPKRLPQRCGLAAARGHAYAVQPGARTSLHCRVTLPPRAAARAARMGARLHSTASPLSDTAIHSPARAHTTRERSVGMARASIGCREPGSTDFLRHSTPPRANAWAGDTSPQDQRGARAPPRSAACPAQHSLILPSLAGARADAQQLPGGHATALSRVPCRCAHCASRSELGQPCVGCPVRSLAARDLVSSCCRSSCCHTNRVSASPVTCTVSCQAVAGPHFCSWQAVSKTPPLHTRASKIGRACRECWPPLHTALALQPLTHRIVSFSLLPGMASTGDSLIIMPWGVPRPPPMICNR